MGLLFLQFATFKVCCLLDKLISRLNTSPCARQEQRGGNRKRQEFHCSAFELSSSCPPAQVCVFFLEFETFAVRCLESCEWSEDILPHITNILYLIRYAQLTSIPCYPILIVFLIAKYLLHFTNDYRLVLLGCLIYPRYQIIILLLTVRCFP